MNTLTGKPALSFPNDTKVDEYQLTHKGKIIFTGTENRCYMKLQNSQSQSADWAMKNDGWKVEQTGKQIDDPIIEVEAVKMFLNVLTFKYRGETYRITKDAVYGHLGLLKPGDKVKVDSHYAMKPF
jgi:hypothetical protein